MAGQLLSEYATNRKSVFMASLGSLIRLFIIAGTIYCYNTLFNTFLYSDYSFSSNDSYEISIFFGVFIVSFCILMIIFDFTLYSISKYLRQNINPINIFNSLTIGLFLLAPVSLANFKDIISAELIIMIIGGLGILFWRENSKFVSKWDYAASLYNKIYYDEFSKDNVSLNKILNMSCTLSLDLIELNYWNHASFINIFKYTIEIALNFNYQKKVSRWLNPTELIDEIHKDIILLASPDHWEEDDLLFLAFDMHSNKIEKLEAELKYTSVSIINKEYYGVHLKRDQLKSIISNLRKNLLIEMLEKGASKSDLEKKMNDATIALGELTQKLSHIEKELDKVKGSG